jgi:RNA-directed DNA polymerase
MESAYQEAEVSKKSGGTRKLSIPCAPLKYLQRRIYEKLLLPVTLHESCHGFRQDHSIVTNAAGHCGKDMVINLDIENFFPTLTKKRIYGIFFRLVPSRKIAHWLAAMTTCRGVLPQGAPTSPALGNLACRRLDRRLHGLAEKVSATYSRYADDLSFSGSVEIIRRLPRIRKIIREEGFEPHGKKERILRRGRRQKVTGLVVNEKVRIPRETRKLLRAIFHREAQGKPSFLRGKKLTAAQIKGLRAFVHAVDPESQLLAAVPDPGATNGK